jgi:hypothetical protein
MLCVIPVTPVYVRVWLVMRGVELGLREWGNRGGAYEEEEVGEVTPGGIRERHDDGSRMLIEQSGEDLQLIYASFMVPNSFSRLVNYSRLDWRLVDAKSVFTRGEYTRIGAFFARLAA